MVERKHRAAVGRFGRRVAIRTAALSLALSAAPGAVLADSFTIGAGQTVTTTQVLDTSGDVGLIEEGGQLNTGASLGVINNMSVAPVTLTNNGAINTTGDNATGALIAGNTSVVTNNGTIKTTGMTAIGIQSIGSQQVITNTGVIELEGDSARGIVSNGSDAVITNSGAISTQGADGDGIFSNSSSARISNSGTINTAGVNADGIGAIGVNANVTNSGVIRVTGLDSVAANLGVASNENTTLTNTGSLIATGDATHAILGGDGNQTVTLGIGSHVIGRIDLGGGNDTLTILEPVGNSQRITIENTETINLSGGSNNAFLLGDTVVTIDPTGQSFLGAAVSALAGSAHGAIARRALRPAGDATGTEAAGTPGAPLQLASLESDTRPRESAGLQSAQRGSAGAVAEGPAAWGEAFGASGKRGTDGQTLAYDHDYIGAIGGYETGFDSFQLGVAAGFALGSIDTDESSIDTDVDSYFVGLYGERDFGRLWLSGSVVGGYEEYENDRLVVDNLNGEETARADFDNLFISPSVTLGAGLPVAESLELRPSGTATYTAAFFDSYSEEGTTASNLSVESRTAQVLNTRLQLAVAMLPAGAEIELRGGLEGRFSDQDDVDGNLAGTNFSFATTEDDSVYGGYVGMNVQVFAADRLSVAGDVEYRTAGGDEDAIRGALRATYRF